MTVQGVQFRLVAYYRPPSKTSLDSLYNFFENSLDSNFILLGDFNFSVVKWEDSSSARAFSGNF